ncbi:MAG: anhydro-N-acetylmuramic acid kinase [Bacteroidota bacterium]
MGSTKQYNVIGLMSGTSLDGVDMAYCRFSRLNDNSEWRYEIVEAKTIKYNSKWIKKLQNLELQNALKFVQTHVEFGHYLGGITNNFINENNLNVDFISSHGHTVFHQPGKTARSAVHSSFGVTSQIGDGAAITAKCNLPVVCDFRSLDVALGGQGAPLVPVGDKLLFPEYDLCLNLGGFANVSFDKDGKRIAFDICPVNIVLNKLVKEIPDKLNTEGIDYDDKGNIAASGKINNDLLKELNQISFYQKSPPRSLSKEWCTGFFFPVIEKYDIPVRDKLRTVCEHIAVQINKISQSSAVNCRMLITGGGVYNVLLINRIKALSNYQIIIPEKNIIDFKEALIFAFLGVLRMRNEINCLKSVTGALKDNIGGAIY